MWAFEPKMLTHDDGRQSIAIGHLSDPCDLKKVFGFELNCDPIVIYIKITNLLKMMEMKFWNLPLAAGISPIVVGNLKIVQLIFM